MKRFFGARPVLACVLLHTEVEFLLMKETETEPKSMMTYSMFDTEQRLDVREPDPPTQRYAWLEHEEGTWCFLTNLFADPGKSMRKWTDEKSALQELENEGWIVVYPYNEQIPADRKAYGCACGYGLMWIDQRMVS